MKYFGLPMVYLNFRLILVLSSYSWRTWSRKRRNWHGQHRYEETRTYSVTGQLSKHYAPVHCQLVKQYHDSPFSLAILLSNIWFLNLPTTTEEVGIPPGVCALLELLKPEVECICLAGFYHLSFICVTSFKQLDCDVITIIIEPPGDLHNWTRCPCI